jgi:hypothetical protein
VGGFCGIIKAVIVMFVRLAMAIAITTPKFIVYQGSAVKTSHPKNDMSSSNWRQSGHKASKQVPSHDRMVIGDKRGSANR